MYWAVGYVGSDVCTMFPSYPLALDKLRVLRRVDPWAEWRLYSLRDFTPPVESDLLTAAYEAEG